MRYRLALQLALLFSVLLVSPTSAAIIVPESDISLTTMDYHATSFEADPNNVKPPALWPDNKSATSSLNTANVSMVAVAGRAGVARASVGVELDWESAGVPWEQIEDIPVEVQIHFRYSLSAVWTAGTGSSNAGITIPGMLATPWFSFYGHHEGDNGGSRSSSEVISFVTTPGELRAKTGDNLRVEVYAQGHGTNNPATTQNSSSASVTVYRVTLKWRPPQPDLAASALEVTQGIQDLNNSVRLVARKRTFVRFHVQSLNAQSHLSDAILIVTRGAQSVQLRPIHPTRTVNVRSSPERGQLLHAFLFEVPTSLTGPGELSLEARVNPDQTMPTESSYTNNSLATTLEFEEAPILHVIFYQIGYTHNGIVSLPPLSHIEAAESWLRRAYPTRALHSWRRTFHIGNGLPEASAVNQYLVTQQARDRSSSTTVLAEGTRYYGMVHDRAGFMRGLAVPVRPLSPGEIILPYVASGPTGTPSASVGWDSDITYGDWYAGHELGHTFARRHPGHPQPQGTPARPACHAKRRCTYDHAKRRRHRWCCYY